MHDGRETVMTLRKRTNPIIGHADEVNELWPWLSDTWTVPGARRGSIKYHANQRVVSSGCLTTPLALSARAPCPQGNGTKIVGTGRGIIGNPIPVR
jgi:hypothetical protein